MIGPLYLTSQLSEYFVRSKFRGYIVFLFDSADSVVNCLINTRLEIRSDCIELALFFNPKLLLALINCNKFIDEEGVLVFVTFQFGELLELSGKCVLFSSREGFCGFENNKAALKGVKHL